MPIDLRNYFPPNLLGLPINDELIDVMQYVLDTYGEDNLDEVLKFYDAENAPKLEKLLRSFGVYDMIKEIALNDEDQMRGLFQTIKSLLSIKGTMRAVEYTLAKSEPPPNTLLIEWYEPEFLPLEPGDSIDDVRGCIDIKINLSDLIAHTNTLPNIIDRFEAIAPYLFPWYLHVYRWIIAIQLEDTVPPQTENLDIIPVIPIEDFVITSESLTVQPSPAITEYLYLNLKSLLYGEGYKYGSKKNADRYNTGKKFNQGFSYNQLSDPTEDIVYGKKLIGGVVDDLTILIIDVSDAEYNDGTQYNDGYIYG